jgi:hypothetical protein
MDFDFHAVVLSSFRCPSAEQHAARDSRTEKFGIKVVSSAMDERQNGSEGANAKG